MRMRFQHATEIEFADVRKSSKPNGIVSTRIKGKKRFKNLLVVFVTVEWWDDETVVKNAIKLIIDHLKMINRKKVFIVPYVHLSHFIAKSERANSITSEIVAGLRKKKYAVKGTSFGYHKNFIAHWDPIYWNIKGHPGSPAFRHLPNTLIGEQEYLIAEIGLKAIKSNEVDYEKIPKAIQKEIIEKKGNMGEFIKSYEKKELSPNLEKLFRKFIIKTGLDKTQQYINKIDRKYK